MNRTIARALRRGSPAEAAADAVTLDYAARFLRRRSLTTEAGAALFVDLPETVSVDDGDAFVTEAGALVAVRAAPEPLLEIAAGPTALARLAWHIGNRHTPAQIEPSRILIQADHVLADMLARLGAAIRTVFEPFTPERGAYGAGRTHAHHAGGPGEHPHEHAPPAARGHASSPELSPPHRHDHSDALPHGDHTDARHAHGGHSDGSRARVGHVDGDAEHRDESREAEGRAQASQAAGGARSHE